MSETVTQGPAAGREFPAEWDSYDDPETDARVTRLTNTPDADSWHLYFTEPCWYDDGRRLLVRSTRGDGTVDLYAVDLDTGRIHQLTDLPTDVGGITAVPDEPAAYFWADDDLLRLDLDRLTLSSLYTLPAGYHGSHVAVTADGARVVTTLSETVDLPRDDDDRESWMAARLDADATSKVVSVPVDGGPTTVHVEATRWLNHVNASPTRPELVTYCEEGPWERVQRIWGLNLETDETWQIRPTGPEEAVGHEYWLADGETVGYHGWRGERDDPDAFFGHVRYDDTECRETPAPDIYTHFHSNSRDLVVGDGSHRGVPFDLLWRWDDDAAAYESPRKLASHGWESDADAHPHSRLSPDDGAVVFDSSRGGDGSDVYLVEIPDDLSTLPRFDGR